MKVYTKVKWLVIIMITTLGCKRELVVSPDFAQAYTRFVVIDAPGNGKAQFYLDGKVNANGDSVIHNADGSLYQPDKTQNATTTINYPSGGWTDNSPINFAGTYGFSNYPGSTYATFPNPTDRIALAPIIDGCNYYNWAALPAAQHQLTFYSVVNSSLFGNVVTVKGNKFLDQSINLEGGALQTFFVVNKSVAGLYLSIENTNTKTALPIYSVQETVNYFSNQYDIVSVKDHPANLPKFKDSSAYIRFLNVCPFLPDQSVNQNSQSLDIYVAPLFGAHPAVYSSYFLKVSNTIDSIGAEVLVSKGLNRFQSAVDAPFFEVNVAANMRINKATGNPDTAKTAGKPRVPKYYRVIAYRSGQSSATGNLPVAQGDWLAVYNQYPGTNYGSSSIPVATGTNFLDSWLVRYDGTNYHPAICTILLSVDQYPFADANYLTNGTSSINNLGFRSCINYQRTGVNSVFFGH